MGFYNRHLFICTHIRNDGKDSCGQHNTAEVQKKAKKRLKELGIHGEGQLRVNKAGCLGRCSDGPIAVVYPDETWYRFVDQEDINEIIDEHLIKGEVVERLKV